MGYDPMIDPELIKNLEFSQGNVRSALIVRFIVGAKHPPSEVEVLFGNVEVTRNHDYKEFGYRCRNQEEYEKFGRASAFILRHLRCLLKDGRRFIESMIPTTSGISKSFLLLLLCTAGLRGGISGLISRMAIVG